MSLTIFGERDHRPAVSRRQDKRRISEAKRAREPSEFEPSAGMLRAGPLESEDLRAQIERAKDRSVIQLLFKAARLLNERAIARVEAPPGAPRLRPAHTSLLPYLDHHGVRLTELARRLGVSKQAVGQLVDELEQMGMVERIPDPADGRAKLIRFSRRGGAALLDGLALLGAIERELGEALGDDRMRELHVTLARMLELLEHT